MSENKRRLFLKIRGITICWSIGLFLVAVSCKPVVLTTKTSDKEAFLLYKQCKRGANQYDLLYNTDSSYAICMHRDTLFPATTLKSFMVLDLQKRKKVKISINEYHKTAWMDSKNIALIRFLGIERSGSGTKGAPAENKLVYLLHVETGEIRRMENRTREK